QPRYAAPGTPVPREADVVPELDAVIRKAVRRALSGDGETGVYLSGGVGSTAVVAAARASSRSLRTFTVAMADEPSPESPFAGRVARLFGMEHQTITVTSKEVADAFDDAVAALGHPNGNAVVVLQLVLARAARTRVPRVLTGDGADQLFGGRMLDAPTEALRRVQRFHRLPGVLRALLRVPLERSERTRDLLVPPDRYLLERGIGGVELCDPAQRRALLLDGLFVRPGVRQDVLAPFYGEVHTDPLNAVMHAFLRSQLGADVLPRVTSTAAATGLSVGFPLLDREVQRMAMLLPGAFKVRGLSGSLPTRWLLRAMLHGTLPPALINRPDRPMPRPLDDWLGGPGRLFLEERFALLREDPLGLWHHTGLEAIKRGLGRSAGSAHRLWALFILDAWARRVGVT
ncbi:MAG TPA: asparagine synthase C-terminal domain-containing protein, partial [Myxococcota bacterium]|nr:asparagine synthase C-terminal domain-containing protein [Myxococcota bacterium]